MSRGDQIEAKEFFEPSGMLRHLNGSPSHSAALNRFALERLNALRMKFEKDGLFKISHARVIGELIICFGISLCSFVFYDKAPALFIVIQSIVCIHVVWWIHDAGHQAYFFSKTTSRLACETLGQIFLGMPQMEYHFDIHRKHHRDTNHIFEDPALQTGPVTWHPLQREQESKVMRTLRPFVWLGIILPLTWPIMTLNCLWLLIVKKRFLRMMLTVGRWFCFFWLFRDKMPLLLIPPLVAGFVLGLSASLNHFHMPIWTGTQPWMKRVFESTQNINPESKLLGWLMGGLNCHVEHHLFPRMPSRHLANSSSEVRALARELGHPYHTHGLIRSFQLLWQKLRERRDSQNFEVAK